MPDASGLDRGHGTDALLFRDDRVGEFGSDAATNGINTVIPWTASLRTTGP
jgi:hypothetical protein